MYSYATEQGLGLPLHGYHTRLQETNLMVSTDCFPLLRCVVAIIL